MDFLIHHKKFFFLSAIIFTLSIFFIFFKGLNLGVDFSGGSVIDVKVDKTLDLDNVRSKLSKINPKISIQASNSNILSIKIPNQSKSGSDLLEEVKSSINDSVSYPEYLKIDFVGPSVGSDLIFKGVASLLVAMAFILIYIWIRFDINFGLGAIFAIFHDVILMFGFYALTQIEFNLSSVAAILTIIGYSINDSVIIYDRIRENLLKNFSYKNLTEVINVSLNATLRRTILTSALTLASLIALVFFGGNILFGMAIAIFFGVIIGTYSSIYIAAPTLLYIEPSKKSNEKTK
jgi:preprotein translocase subunit SecF